MPTAKIRQSNLELLRLIAMFGVLIVHTDFGALGFPGKEELTSTPLYSTIRTLIEFIAIVSVNVFVLISGWFGITFRWRGLCNLLFQCFFFFFGISITLMILGQIEITNWGGAIYKCLMFSDNAWFVKCYIGMYIFAPVMNAFVECANRLTFKRVLICFFIFQSLYGWFSDGAVFIEEGYSTFSFMGLYLLARYFSKYQPGIVRWNGKTDLIVYLALSIVSAMIFIASNLLDKPGFGILMFKYTNPLTIAASMYLLLAFTKWRFTSKLVNSIAVSCFAVYLMHFIIFPTYMRGWIQGIAERYSGVSEFLGLFLLLLAFFCVSIAIDRIRLFIWNKLISPLFSK